MPSLTTGYTVRVISELSSKRVELVEETWRQAREFVKAKGQKGRYDLVLKACLDMLKVPHKIDDSGRVRMFDLDGVITKSNQSWIEIELDDGTGAVSVPLACLLFNNL